MNNYILPKCRIWGTDAEVEANINGYNLIETFDVNSVRAGGKYKIDSDAEPSLRDCDDRTKARLTTWLLEQRKGDEDAPTITKEDIENAKQRPDLPVDERADRLLKAIEEQISYTGEPFFFQENWIPVSESINAEEARFLAKCLAQKKWLFRDPGVAGLDPGGTYRLTIEGYTHLSELKQANPKSTRAFVAMWFGDPDDERERMDNAYERGIKPAIEAAGYRPVRSDKMDHLDKIDDRIVAEIRRSRFVVADFTQGKSGARGGVYFEAGFAKGLNIEVIFTCRKDSIKNVHFDTRQYRHIVWETPEELQTELLNCIRANIGQAPLPPESR